MTSPWQLLAIVVIIGSAFSIVIATLSKWMSPRRTSWWGIFLGMMVAILGLFALVVLVGLGITWVVSW